MLVMHVLRNTVGNSIHCDFDILIRLSFSESTPSSGLYKKQDVKSSFDCKLTTTTDVFLKSVNTNSLSQVFITLKNNNYMHKFATKYNYL